MNKIYVCTLEQFSVEDFTTVIHAKSIQEVVRKYGEYIQNMHDAEGMTCMNELKLTCRDTSQTIVDVLELYAVKMETLELSYIHNVEAKIVTIVKEKGETCTVILEVDYNEENWEYRYPKYLSVMTEAYNIKYLDYLTNEGKYLSSKSLEYWLEIDKEGIKVFEAMLGAVIYVHQHIEIQHEMETKCKSDILTFFTTQMLNY